MLHNLPHGGTTTTTTTTSSSSGVVGEEWSIEALSPWRQARRDVRVREDGGEAVCWSGILLPNSEISGLRQGLVLQPRSLFTRWGR